METLNAPPPFASQVNRDLARDVAWVLHKGLAKKPDERFRSRPILLPAWSGA